jgi:hypothetical protein
VVAAGIARQPHSRLVRIGILGKQIAAVECGSSDADSVDRERMRRRSPIACRAGERHPKIGYVRKLQTCPRDTPLIGLREHKNTGPHASVPYRNTVYDNAVRFIRVSLLSFWVARGVISFLLRAKE